MGLVFQQAGQGDGGRVIRALRPVDGPSEHCERHKEQERLGYAGQTRPQRDGRLLKAASICVRGSVNGVHMRIVVSNMNVVNIGGIVTRTYHHGALAEAMVEQALAEVRLRGADQVSLRAIAQSLDVSPSAAYNHFPDKDGLLRAVGSCGLAALDERMARVLAAHPGDTAEAAKARFAGLGRAYLGFASDETHLFQLTFGPICAAKERLPGDTGPYGKLSAALDDLDRCGLLRPGIRDGLDLTVWASTHGMACLIVEGLIPSEAAEAFIDSMGRLILAEDG